MSVKVEKVEIKIGRKVISLTPDELRELRNALEDLFPAEKVRIVSGAPIIIDRPYRVPDAPWRRPWTPYWCGTGDTSQDTSKRLEDWSSVSGKGTLRLECKA